MNTRLRACQVHRTALFDFVDGQPWTPGTRAALDHLEGCRPCEDELAGIVRTVAALRRLGQTVVAVEPPGDVWVRLRSTAERPRARRWAAGGNVAGALLALSIVAMTTVRLGALPRFVDSSAPPAAISRLDGFEPKIIRLSPAGATVYATVPDKANPQPPDGDRGNLAGVRVPAGSGDGPSRPVSKA